MRGGTVIYLIPRSPHIWAWSLSVPFGQIQWHSSKCESILNSDSSVSLPSSQIVRFSEPTVWQELRFCSLQHQQSRSGSWSDSQKLVHHKGLPIPKSTIGCRELRGKVPFPSTRNILTNIKGFRKQSTSCLLFPIGVGEPKLTAKHTVVEHCHPLCEFGRVCCYGKLSRNGPAVSVS